MGSEMCIRDSVHTTSKIKIDTRYFLSHIIFIANLSYFNWNYFVMRSNTIRRGRGLDVCSAHRHHDVYGSAVYQAFCTNARFPLPALKAKDVYVFVTPAF